MAVEQISTLQLEQLIIALSPPLGVKTESVSRVRSNCNTLQHTASHLLIISLFHPLGVKTESGSGCVAGCCGCLVVCCSVLWFVAGHYCARSSCWHSVQDWLLSGCGCGCLGVDVCVFVCVRERLLAFSRVRERLLAFSPSLPLACV